MPATPQDLYSVLDELGINHETVEHPPVFTAADEPEWRTKVPGLHCKNLYMETKSGEKWLVVMPAFERAQLGTLFQKLGAGRMSFCKGEDMLPILGVSPGSATPFALMNGTARDVRVAVDRNVAESAAIGIHPLHNAATTVVSGADLLTFLRHYGFDPVIFEP